MSDMSKGNPAILFTAFEPSGDAHAAPVIAELRRQAPNITIYAWGGPQMEQAGATIIEQTTGNAAMGLGALKKVGAVRRELAKIKRWSRQYRVLAHVAVDSPAANFPACKITKKTGARIINLVAPQVWAWAPWRIGKVRKLSDLVLCLLPFEEQYFNDRGVTARFIGHPRINRELDEDMVREMMHGLPSGAPRIGIFPGSRPQEVKANIGLLTRTYAELQGRHHTLAGVIVATDGNIAKIIRRRIKVFPTGLHMVTGQSDSVIAWADLCLAVSGTITFDIAKQRKAMIGVYKTGFLSWLLSLVLLRTSFRLLPNIVAEREIVPEFVPHPWGPSAIVSQATKLLTDSKKQAIQTEELARVLHRFANKHPAEEAAKLIIRMVKYGTIDKPKSAPSRPKTTDVLEQVEQQAASGSAPEPKPTADQTR